MATKENIITFQCTKIVTKHVAALRCLINKASDLVKSETKLQVEVTCHEKTQTS